MTQDTANLISALTGRVSAGAAIAAAYAAYKSAATAQQAAKAAESIHRHGIIEELILSTNQGIAETMRVDRRIAEMKRTIKDIQHLGGSPDEHCFKIRSTTTRTCISSCRSRGNH
jgi:poly(3-hydroxybutyrate) depolymerase